MGKEGKIVMSEQKERLEKKLNEKDKHTRCKITKQIYECEKYFNLRIFYLSAFIYSIFVDIYFLK